MGLALAGFGTILGAVNFITTIFCMRAPGMTMFRMPIFTWNILLTSVLVLMAFPVLAAALLVLEADRKLGAHVFDPANHGAMLWQHLFWFFGHPEVYIIALPFFGIVSEILPVFSRKPIFGYKGLVFATISIAGLSVTVWAHHMFPTGAVLLPFFSFMTFLIAVPTGVKFFNWIGTMWRGSLTFETPMLWAIGFLVTFLFGGLTGMILASPPLDWPVSDTYFVVAHFHYVVFGTVVFAMFGGFYFWWPKLTGHMLDERLGKIHFWTLFVGFHTDVPDPALAGRRGHAAPLRRLSASDGFTTLNTISTIGSFLLGASTLPFLYNVWKSSHGPKVTTDDPWGYGRSLEWATSCPPPRHNFLELPRIRSESPAFDLHYPHVAALDHREQGQEPARRGLRRAGPGLRARGRPAMKIEGLLFFSGFVFFSISAVIYGLLSGEPAGTAALAFTAGLAFLVGYLPAVHRRRIDSRPEDRLDAEIADGAGELGFYSPHSWWPLAVGFSAAVAFAGIAFGWWLFIIGAGLGAWPSSGWSSSTTAATRFTEPQAADLRVYGTGVGRRGTVKARRARRAQFPAGTCRFVICGRRAQVDGRRCNQSDCSDVLSS